LVLQGGAHVTC